MMHNYFAIETESDHRQREWIRAAQADARAAQVHPVTRRLTWPKFPLAGLASLRWLVAPWLPTSVFTPTRCRVATC